MMAFGGMAEFGLMLPPAKRATAVKGGPKVQILLPPLINLNVVMAIVTTIDPLKFTCVFKELSIESYAS